MSEDKDAVIVRETYTGNFISRPEFQKLLKVIKSGDTINLDSVSRMIRNAADGFALYKELYNKGVNLIFLKEHHIDTATYSDSIKKQVNINIATGDSATDDFLNGQIELLNKYVLVLAEKQIYLSFEQAQKEVDYLRQRTREGIETARRNSKRIGNTAGSVLHVKNKEPIKELIKKHS